jgi:hypothetical protein
VKGGIPPFVTYHSGTEGVVAVVAAATTEPNKQVVGASLRIGYGSAGNHLYIRCPSLASFYESCGVFLKNCDNYQIIIDATALISSQSAV